MIQVILIEAGEGYGIKFVTEDDGKIVDPLAVLTAVAEGVAIVHTRGEQVTSSFFGQPVSYTARVEWTIEVVQHKDNKE